MIIYMITNLVNGKIYIGQDKNDNPKYFGSGDLIKKAIIKYGITSFRKDILKQCSNQKELDEFERFYIMEYNSTNKKIGYNIAVGGRNGTTLNRKMSPETREKMSKARSGKKFTEQHKENLSKSHTGKSIPEEVRNKMRESQKLIKHNPLSEETKRKISISKSGSTHTHETKLKMSENRKGENNPFYGKTHSEEYLSKRRKPIIQLTLNNEFIKEWPGVNEAARQLNIKQCNISAVLSGKQTRTKNFKFKYKDEK